MQEQAETINQLNKIMEIFKASDGEIRPHYILTGPSGSGKSHSAQLLAETHELNYHEINAAQLTKEGTSGNSLSKALSPLANTAGRLTLCFVDEFDKLFISGNSNSQLAHETTNGVQNEFLKILESKSASVYGDYGKYVDINIDKVLFVFAGAFNGEEDIDVDKLRNFGIKTEFIGRVGLVYNLKKLSLESMGQILESSPLLNKYLELFPSVDKQTVTTEIMTVVSEAYEKNTLGVRLINTLLNKYFVNGGKLSEPETKQVAFQKILTL
jgi:ATP-dependent protease Clp ATPase subunit